MANYYPFGGSHQPPELSSLDWPELEDISHLTFIPEQRDTLLAELNSYISDAVWQHFSPHMKTVKRRLQSIESHARKLVALVSSPPSQNYAPPEEAAFALYQAVLSELSVLDPTNAETRKQVLRDLIIGAKGALERLHTQGLPGQHPRVGLRRMICRWYTVYQMAGGTGYGCSWSEISGQYEGAFLDLVDAALAQAAVRIPKEIGDRLRPSKSTLAQIIFAILRRSQQQGSTGKK